jgi:hypothetical protein
MCGQGTRELCVCARAHVFVQAHTHTHTIYSIYIYIYIYIYMHTSCWISEVIVWLMRVTGHRGYDVYPT